jgi:hypothetical protein
MTATWLKDTVERAAATYVEVLLGLLIAGWTTDKIDLSFLASAALAAVPTGLAVIKAALASRIGETVSPASVARDA